MRAVQNSTTTRYGVGARREGPQKDGDEEQSQSALILGQDLGKLGLGAVVWDCVSECCWCKIVMKKLDRHWC